MKGNEGKTWYQDYIAALYGHARVVRLYFKMNMRNTLHILSKRPLCSTDIFLFNERRALNHDSANYTILEAIKDGIAVSSKYNSEILQFKGAQPLQNTQNLQNFAYSNFCLILIFNPRATFCENLGIKRLAEVL